MAHLLGYLSQGPPLASKCTFPAFTSMTTVCGVCFAPSLSPADPPSLPRPPCVLAQLCSQPTCGSDPLSGPHPSRRTRRKRMHFPRIPFVAPRLLCHHYGLTCSILQRPHLNIPLWHHNTSNMPQDTIQAGQGGCSHLPLHERNCCRLPSLT